MCLGVLVCLFGCALVCVCAGGCVGGCVRVCVRARLSRLSRKFANVLQTILIIIQLQNQGNKLNLELLEGVPLAVWLSPRSICQSLLDKKWHHDLRPFKPFVTNKMT